MGITTGFHANHTPRLYVLQQYLEPLGLRATTPGWHIDAVRGGGVHPLAFGWSRH